MIDAEHKGEERYSKLSLAYETKDEEKKVVSVVENTIKKYQLQPNIYNCALSHGKTALIVEYHDDYDREAGVIFDSILKQLSLTKC